MRNRKIVITGAGRGLGRALSIVAARRDAFPILLGRSEDALQNVADVISNDSSPRPDIVVCDLSDTASVTQAAAEIALSHPDIDILVNNGAHWTGGAFENQTNDQILAVVNSAVTGTLVLARQLLPLLKARAHADIHTVVSMSGLPYTRFAGASLPFRAAKSAQDGFAKGLVEELRGSSVRVTSIYPGMIEDVPPEAQEWDRERGINESLTNKDVVDAILFALSAPTNVSFRQIVIERTRSDFLLSG